MHLRSLTMKGFKSFADPTTIELEPGITVVVGPNGSGKSNVVDAVAWVLGAQGPRVVRSQKMDDVIFVGTQKRAALGRAEVTLTIDNADRRLGIEFSEVTIRRTLFRSGESEYELNGVACRLLDIQELLSDTGVGRTQHVIISQGQLDGILSANPEERRAVIEEAAGVLKYRRRRERAARRLDASEQGLLRVQDLLREVRRQLRPLERQAASATQHAELSAELDRLRRIIAQRELRGLQSARVELASRATELERAAAVLRDEIETAAARIEAAERALSEAPPDELAPSLARLVQLLERARGLLALVEERARSKRALLHALDDSTGLVELRESLERTTTDLDALRVDEEAIEDSRAALARSESELVAVQAARGEETVGVGEDDVTLRAAAARGLLQQHRALLAGHVQRRSQVAQRIETLHQRVAEVEARRVETGRQLAVLRDEHAVLEARADAAVQVVAGAAEAMREAEHQLALASEHRHGLSSRVEAFLDALNAARTEAGVELLFGMQGVLGTLLDLVEVDDSIALAFEAAVEYATSAVVVGGVDDARAAIAHLRAIGRSASLLVAPSEHLAPVAPPFGAERLRDAVRGASPEVDRLLDRLVGDVFLVRGGLDSALSVLDRAPNSTVVTADGDRLSPLGWRIGAARSGATTAALAAARAQLDVASARHDEALASFQANTAAHKLAEEASIAAQRALAPLPAKLAALEQAHGEQVVALDVLGSERDSAAQELVALQALVDHVETEVAVAEFALREVAEEEAIELSLREAADVSRRELEERARTLQHQRRDLDVSSATLTERRSLLMARALELRGAIQERVERAEDALARRSEYVAEIQALQQLASLLSLEADRVAAEVETLTGEQRRRQEAFAAQLSTLASFRAEKERLEHESTLVGERRQRVEIEQAESRVRYETSVESLRHELDLSPEELLAQEEPALPIGMDAAARRRQVERELRELGPVNLLAQEELAALSERNTFLESQLEDIRATRRELNQIIRAVDQEIVTVFTEAFADVALNFERLITTLFPGGSGSITLTNADDLLESGVEIEARPAGRNVRRLSLLSGGERSLVAMAFLFAVFRSRPSPFYLMDEVEAALDDANLQRFLALIDDFRDDAQLIIVSHQKRTMEVADALYGISMQPGGASKVVSERLRRPTSVDPALPLTEVNALHDAAGEAAPAFESSPAPSTP